MCPACLRSLMFSIVLFKKERGVYMVCGSLLVTECSYVQLAQAPAVHMLHQRSTLLDVAGKCGAAPLLTPSILIAS